MVTTQGSCDGMAFSRYASRRRSGTGRVVLLHGIPGSSRSWSAVAHRLSETGVDVVVPDLLGFGSSERPRELTSLHAAAQAAAVTRLIEEIGNPVTLVGHDFGGPVALLVGDDRPDLLNAIGLFATNAFADTPIPFPLSLIGNPLLGVIASAALFSRPSLAMMLRTGVGRPRRKIGTADNVGDRQQRRAIATIFRGSLTQLEELYRPVQDALAGIMVPAVVGWGDRDPFFPIEQGHRTAAALGVSLQIYRGAGHFLPDERPAEIARDIEALVLAAVG